MDIKLPQTFSDLSIREWCIINSDFSARKRLKELAGIDEAVFKKISKKALDVAYDHIEKLKKEEYCTHAERLSIQGKEYGFINDWDAFTMGEYIDMEHYCKDFNKNATKILSILYREIDREDYGGYILKEYTAKENHKIFEDMPASILGGCLSFFLTTRRTWLNNTRHSLVEALGMISRLNGDGTQHYTHFPERASSIWMKLRRKVSELFSRIFVIYKT